MESDAMVAEPVDRTLAPLDKLESRVQHAIEQLRAARRAQATAQEEIARLRHLLAEREQQIERLTSELGQGRAGQEQVRQRIEKLLDQVEQLSES